LDKYRSGGTELIPGIMTHRACPAIDALFFGMVVSSEAYNSKMLLHFGAQVEGPVRDIRALQACQQFGFPYNRYCLIFFALDYVWQKILRARTEVWAAVGEILSRV
jgi:hypothetical protein